MGREAGWCASLPVGDWLRRGRPDQVKPTFRTKCPSLRLSTPPPARCTMYASKMMARITTTSQKKNTMTPGMAYPDIVLALAMATRYPPPPDLMRRRSFPPFDLAVHTESLTPDQIEITLASPPIRAWSLP